MTLIPLKIHFLNYLRSAYMYAMHFDHIYLPPAKFRPSPPNFMYSFL